MPTLSIFYGIVIQIYWVDHPPPHFHARYGEHEAQIDIRKIRVHEGSLPGRAEAMVMEWTRVHQMELLAAWDAAASDKQCEKIAPLK